MLTIIKRLSALRRTGAATRSLGLIAALCLVGHAPVRAEAGDWNVEVVPYLWGSSVSGDVATFAGLPTANIDASFSDILDNIDMGAMLSFAATKGRFGIVGDLQYVDLGVSTGTPGPAFGGVEVDSKQLIATLGAEWVAVQKPGDELRVIGGLRYWNVDSTLSFLPGGLPAARASGSDDWLDGMVGLRGRHDLNERTFLTGWAMIGAGGSDFTADVMAGAGYRLSDRTTLIGGYRYLTVDRTNGAFVYDVEQQGLILGVKLTFN